MLATTIIFAVSIVLILVIFLEVKLSFKFLRRFDSAIQSFVSRVSQKVLKISTRAESYLLVHLYKMSADTVKTLFREATDRRDALLEKLQGSGQKFLTQKATQNVSPYFKEIPKIDSRGE